MKLLYATENASKICNMRYRLTGYDIEIITPKDIGIHIEVDENGTTPIENARLKARAYFDKTGIPTLAADSGLYIDDIPDEAQPGLFVRRVNGKKLSDHEMIQHYCALSNTYGGKLTARYVTGLVLLLGDELEHSVEIPDDDFIISNKPNENRAHRGNPLDVVTICPANGKYFNDCSLEELAIMANSFDKKCIGFLKGAGIL